MEKPKGEKFDVGGVLYDKVRLTMVLDGFTAPVTAGTITDLIQRGKSSGRLLRTKWAGVRVAGWVFCSLKVGSGGQCTSFYRSGRWRLCSRGCSEAGSETVGF